jgi:hypothetical protein
MGLDIDFYHNGEELFSLRKHHEFFCLFDEDIGGRVSSEYSDFYVTEDTLDKVEAALHARIRHAKLQEQGMVKTVPAWFWGDGDDLTWVEMLRYYPAVVELMRDAVQERGYLICSYSA